MAARSGGETADKALGEKDLGDLCNTLHPVCKKYKFLGLQIGVMKSEIETIEAQHNDPSERLLEILSVRLKETKALTWNDIDAALRSSCVGEKKVADGIREKYRHLFSSEQEHGTREKKKKGRRERYATDDADGHIGRSSDRQEEDSGGEVSGQRAPRTKHKKPPEKHSRGGEKESISAEEEVREPGGKYYAHHTQRQHKEIGMGKERRGKSKRESILVTYAQVEHRSKVPVKAEGEREKESSIRDEFSETESENTSENQSDSEMTKSKVESDNETSASSSEEYTMNSPVQSAKTGKSRATAREKKPESVELKGSGRERKQKDKHRHQRASDGRGYWELREREYQSDGEKHKMTNIQSDNESSESSNEEGTVPKTRKSRASARGKKFECEEQEKSRRKSKQKDKHRGQRSGHERSHWEVRERGHQSDYEKQKMTKAKRDYDNETSESSGGAETMNLPPQSAKASKSRATAREKELRSGKQKDKHGYQRAGDERSRYSDGEVREKPPHKSNDVKSESESDIEIKTRKEPRSGKKKATQTPLSAAETLSPGSTKEPHFKSKKRKRNAPQDEAAKAVSREKYLPAHSKQSKKPVETRIEREVSSARKTKKATPLPVEEVGSDGSQNDSEDKETDLDRSSVDEDSRRVDEEERDPKQKLSNEEQEVEPENESTAASGEEEMTKIAGPYKKESMKETRKREVKAAKESGGRRSDQGEHIIQPKKKSRRRHRECGTARGSSSPSTSQEDKQRQSDSRGQRRKKEHGSGYKKDRKQEERSSETDDTSPECDMTKNGSKPADGKKLRKTFRQFFGHLCCEITNPVQVAAQLQKKGLISHSMMKDMITSPESQQAKTINLVGALDKKIKSRPDRLFLFIEVLLESSLPQLQQAGREMSRKAGEVCPDREVAKLPTPFQTVTSSSDATVNQREGQSNKGNFANTASVEGQSTVASLQVSQTAPQLSPVLSIYKGYLKAYYNARALAPADKYLPTLNVPYINLAMVGREYCGLEQRDEFTRQTLHGGVDQILQSKAPISIKDLLTPEEGGRQVRFALVEGPPGIGKSTFAWEVCRRWDEIESLRVYHTVVLLKLREKWVLNATSPSDLFRYPPDPEFSKAIAKALNSSHGHNLLLILDGFDEVSHNFHENSVIKSILCRQLLPECTIILTTRPSAKYTLRSVCQPEVDKHVEIIGFTEEERVRYITEVFHKEPELQVNFLKYMFLVPHIKSMMYIPLNCAIIAQVYYESQSSHNLAIPRTRTQLYKALTHSLLVRHMKMKDSNCEYSSVLPEGLDDSHMERFRILAKFAFDSYHKGESRKVTFFKEDIPEGLVHFGFMNESTEMYAGKGIGKTFSFLHLSLQEYLAAWHLANSYSIEFQVAYHWLSVSVPPKPRYLMLPEFPPPPSFFNDTEKETLSLPPFPHSLPIHFPHAPPTQRVTTEGGKALILSLEQQGALSLREPAIFLAGITGWRCQSDFNHWEMYLSHDTADLCNPDILLPCLYEAQNPSILPHYFAGEASRKRITICYSNIRTPYDCYAFSYCLAHSSYPLSLLVLDIEYESDISLVETFVKGLDDHGKNTTPNINLLQVELDIGPLEEENKCLSWLMKSKLVQIQRVRNIFRCLSSAHVNYLQSLVNVKLLKIHVRDSIESWEWLSVLQSLSNLKILHISSGKECSPPPNILLNWLMEWELTEVVFDTKLPSNVVQSSMVTPVDSVPKSVLRSNPITEMVLPNISRQTMASVHGMLLHCPSLTRLVLYRTRLGYDGILYICSTLRTNKILRNLIIDDVEAPPSRERRGWDTIYIDTFSSMETIPLPSKTTPTDFLLELNNILQDNTTLEEMKIQSGLFLPLSAGEGREYCQWTGLGPLQQFNVGAVASGMSPNLRRSFSLSDLTQPQTAFFWDRRFRFHHKTTEYVDFRELFSNKMKRGKNLFSRPSFTAPDTHVLQSFSALDPRLKECLEISHLHQYVERLRNTYQGLLGDISYYIQRFKPSLSESELDEEFDIVL